MSVTREFLKTLGIEGDSLEKIMSEVGKDKGISAEKVELQSKIDSLTSQNDDLNSQIKERDGQLSTLKKSAGDNEELKAQIKSLQDENKQAATDYQSKLAEQSKNFKIDSALRDAKARNPKAVKALLDLDKVSVDGDNLVGFKDQLEAVQKDNDFLFEQGEQNSNNQNQNTATHATFTGNASGDNANEPTIVQRIAQRMTGGQ
ncbi:phage scaffolding protein [Liquorilactobacillus mali]|uniref:Scaffolding protein n=1 Tax=Liquorilactobacillus mali KCTC 3596 = DSM 20444 TaxID=1046596 RepID=J0UPW3_9LACO|nr:phage scaffolding protein [Liquorilactobacillus mali]EJE97702.1 scaffolding protein [Liquorilactobacillus mali KCTC 3596 = DSM 20444]KRN08804.1 scaffolding protein [Liquorilactobacillus mali KCTC 3596 = DSM 20444]QFQ75151.1 scaffolding protein [Liquorilactobacillus mali]